MRYTASANSFLWYLFIPFLVIFYISFLFWSDRNFSNNPVQEVIIKKQEAVNSLASIDGIILGGSNAQFGISAISLNKLSDLTWVNLGIPGEGYSDINYFNFISNSLNDLKRLDVSFVIYSSSTFLEKSLKNDLSINLFGKKKISYKPQRSLASYLKSNLGYNKKSTFPIANAYGDLLFRDNYCDHFSSTPLSYRNYLNEVDLRIWMPMQLTRISELFPNAKIIITVPNGFYKNEEEGNFDTRNNLLKVVQDIFFKHELSDKNSLFLLSQKPYPSSNLMCGDFWHPNEGGREWRTNQLYEFINDQLLNK